MTRILFVGQKPETVDFSDPALPPGFDAEKINAGIAVAVAKIGERGWQGDTCMITPDEAGRAMLEKTLKGAAYASNCAVGICRRNKGTGQDGPFDCRTHPVPKY
jgi:hypothetical protein